MGKIFFMVSFMYVYYFIENLSLNVILYGLFVVSAKMWQGVIRQKVTLIVWTQWVLGFCFFVWFFSIAVNFLHAYHSYDILHFAH